MVWAALHGGKVWFFLRGFIICGAVFLPSLLFPLFLVQVHRVSPLSPLNTISVIDYHHRMNIHIHALWTHAICIHTPYSFYTYTSMQNRGLVAIGILGHGESSGLRFFSGPGLFSYLLFCRFPSGSVNWGVFIFCWVCSVIEWGCRQAVNYLGRPRRRETMKKGSCGGFLVYFFLTQRGCWRDIFIMERRRSMFQYLKDF